MEGERLPAGIKVMKTSWARTSPTGPLLGALLAALCSGCVGKIFSSGNSPTQTQQQAAYNPAFACTTPTLAATPIRRLARVHYINSVQGFLSQMNATDLATVMGDIQTQISLIPEDSSPFFSRNDTSLTEEHAGGVFELAFALGSILAENSTYVGELATVCGAGSTQASLTGACANTFAAYYAQKAFRRPATAAELATLLLDPTSTTTPQATLDLTTVNGLTLYLVRLLAHPRFYYRLDNEGTLVSGTDGTSGATYQLSNYELLSKLTFLFWDGPPTDALYTQIQSADLTQLSQLRNLVSTIVNDPAAQNGVENFYSEWLGIQSLPQLDSMNSASYATFAQGENINVAGHNHRADMIQEVIDLTTYYTFGTTGRYDDLMESPYSFSRTTDLAKLYGLSTTWDGTPATLTQFPASQPRSGLLTRAAFLITGVEYTDPIIKGKNLRFNILCDVLPPPPPTVNVVPVKQDTVHTTRWLVEQVTAGTPSNPYQCMQCHSQMNPLGFLSENYDSLGRFRTLEQKFDPTTGMLVNQVPVTTAAVASLYPGDTQEQSDISAMSTYLAQTGAGQRCMVQQYFRYTFGREESLVQDGCTLEDMRQNMVNTDGTGFNDADGSLLQMFESTTDQKQFLFREVQ
jgi:hypothetical protein